MAEVREGWLVVRVEDKCPNNFSHQWIIRPWPEIQTPHCMWCGRTKQ